MVIRSVSRLAPLLGFVVSPFFTAPAVGAHLDRGALARVLSSEAAASSRPRHLATNRRPGARRGNRPV